MKHLKHLKPLVLAALVLVLALPAQAQEFKKCEKDFQTCINELIKQLQTRGWIGISLSQIDDKIVVRDMAQEGPAAKGGFKQGDVIVGLNGTKYNDLGELVKAHSKLKVGDVLAYKVVRDGKEQDLDVLLTEATAPIIGIWIGEHIIENYVRVEGEMVKLP